MAKPPPAPPPIITTTNTTTRTSSSLSFAAESSQPKPHPSPQLVASSLLQPRVAVALRVKKPWYPWLFACRLLSIVPALWWGLQSGLQLFLQLVYVISSNPDTCPSPRARGSRGAERPFPWTETTLAVIWCGAASYLSFFFTDCLMSRWLLHYTPQATIVRLLTINACNAYLTSWILFLTGGFDDPRLLLPGWIGIATTLTVCYHITQRKINIRKETSTSLNVFSIASFISMVSLLAHLHSNESEYPQIPLLSLAKRGLLEILRILNNIVGSSDMCRAL